MYAGTDICGMTREEWRHGALETIVDCCEDAMATLTLDGTVMTWNPAATEIYGYDAAEAVGRNISALVVPAELRPELWRWLREIAAGGEVRHETRRVRLDGAEILVSVRGLPMRDARRRVIGSAWIARDVTDHRQRGDHERSDTESRLWRQRIDEALADDRLAFATQPVVDIRSGETDHHELTLRMRLGDRIAKPAEFIGPAELSGQIRSLDRWVVRHGLELAVHHPVAINVSGRSLGNDGLLAEIERELGSSGAEPGHITFELTETAAADDLERATASVERLKALGCRVALDDFGTGYGSFSYLSRVPADELKIDREFVSQLRFSDTNWRIIDAIVAVGRNLGMTIVGEGVEDEATLELLESLGVDLAQGYFLGRPQLVEAGWNV
ncbi:MAG TPA: EAL domain-containing protein [Solirubrobacterales bacterium]|nr:EAL domain-containing protein [Solirubrobacterales bacterium]